jgi:hypothetical protein
MKPNIIKANPAHRKQAHHIKASLTQQKQDKPTNANPTDQSKPTKKIKQLQAASTQFQAASKQY